MSSARMRARLAPAAVSNRVRRVPATGRTPPVADVASRLRRRRARRGLKRGILSQDGALDPLQSRARFNGEFLHQHPACRP
jgi:hypothetical protein